MPHTVCYHYFVVFKLYEIRDKVKTTIYRKVDIVDFTSSKIRHV